MRTNKKTFVDFGKKALKFALFVLLFALIYFYTRDVLRNKSESEALGIILDKPDNSYDVVLAGPSHMQNGIYPAELFGKYGIVSCNTSTPAQSLPTTYYVVKEMIERHNPKLVAVDLFCAFYEDEYFSPARFHQVADNFEIGRNKIDAIENLTKDDEDKNEYYLNYLLYHGRWKELTKSDYTAYDEFDETAQIPLYFPEDCGKPFSPVTYFENDFVPIDREECAEIPDIVKEYLDKIISLCEETDTQLLLLVVPYRADVDNNDVSGVYQQKVYNSIEKYCNEKGVDFLNMLHFIDEIGFDFNTDMAEFSHLNYRGAQKVSDYFGEYVKENYEVPDRREDAKYKEWLDIVKKYKERLEEIISETDKVFPLSPDLGE